MWFRDIRWISLRAAGLLLAVAVMTPRAMAQPDCVEVGHVCFEMLEGYTLQKVETKGGVDFHEFIRFGGRAALERELPVHKFDATYIDSWLGSDAYRQLKVALVDLPPADQAQAQSRIAERFHNGFASRWGPPAFAVFDEEKQIGHSTNVSGAFIGAHVTRCGAKMILIEAFDVIEFLRLSNANYQGIGDPDVGVRWRAARATSNTNDAEALIANICTAIAQAGD